MSTPTVQLNAMFRSLIDKSRAGLYLFGRTVSNHFVVLLNSVYVNRANHAEDKDI